MEGEFYLPREAAARLRALLDAYAKPRAEGDDRPLRVRNADAFIALLEDKIATELLVLVSAESLPTDPEPGTADPEPSPADPEPSPADPEPSPADAEPGPTGSEPGPTDPEPGSGRRGAGPG
ncbi:hypothetical protein GCM10010116_33550 [Microbispora rosea subsp. aerata]|nr:DUF222 domain-containing protein [Microbispora rosea]GGO16635.1 hypothetical protein GCM10010116_33550 [Microbispora rosea subsp. aerata]GIH56032.1 hypothetical protein Mro02_29460 [Microbispora rosea subsp. aerata]GLJ86633.1 hypothetical protein GCM10017588_53710 [Microbispora rosea subsp. aerata]